MRPFRQRRSAVPSWINLQTCRCLPSDCVLPKACVTQYGTRFVIIQLWTVLVLRLHLRASWIRVAPPTTGADAAQLDHLA